MRIPAFAPRARDERGSALLLALLISIAVSSLALTAVVMAGNSQLINAYEQRQGELEAAADAGIELGRAMLNVDGELFPTTGYRALVDRQPVAHASGGNARDIWRSIYAGPVGNTTGQFGTFGNLVVIAGDAGPDRVIRRTDITLESFAKYAYFTNVEPANIAFGAGDYITGPVHSNDQIKIYDTCATFQGPVSTHETFSGEQYATFLAGSVEGASIIPMPTTRNLNDLRDRAQEGGASFSGSNGGTAGQARVRVEFVGVDLNNDGNTTGDDEGFFKVYILNNDNQANREWLVAGVAAGDPDAFTDATNLNCGALLANNLLRPADVQNDAAWQAGANTATNQTTRRRNVLTPNAGPAALPAATRNAPRRCFLGGSNALNSWTALAAGGEMVASPARVTGSVGGQFVPNDGRGTWQQYSATPDARVVAAAGAVQARYLFPLSHDMNPNFKGVIYVGHKVVISGVVRGQVTVASPSNVVIGDDLTYATDPGAGLCADMLGLFSGGDILVADNMINTPQDVDPGGTDTYRTHEELPADERVHAVLLALNTFTVENYDSGPTASQSCDGTPWGRGCLRITGGIIQERRGAVWVSNGTGHLKRYGYDACAAQYPPPYFPTTGKFRKVGVYEIDPTGFSLDQIF